jgi:hypothetical protein
VLERFWDAVLGNPPLGTTDDANLKAGLASLCSAKELQSSMALLVNGLSTRMAEQTIAARCAELLAAHHPTRPTLPWDARQI